MIGGAQRQGQGTALYFDVARLADEFTGQGGPGVDDPQEFVQISPPQEKESTASRGDGTRVDIQPGSTAQVSR
jgi:hypothetical protein